MLRVVLSQCPLAPRRLWGGYSQDLGMKKKPFPQQNSGLFVVVTFGGLWKISLADALSASPFN